MFSKHVTNQLSAYCHGELAAEDSRGIAEHLIGCSRCREQFEEIKLGVKLAEHLPQQVAPDSLWQELQARMIVEAGQNRVAPIATSRNQSRFTFKGWQPAFAGVAVGLLLAVALGGWLFYVRESRPFWDVARLNGSPTIGSWRMDQTGRLAVGQWLETDGSSRAKIDVGTIGHVEIDPNTRVRLIETKVTEHRLELARGKMSAKIWAPPRLFFVDTPSAVAADMGCAYTLEVDDSGASLLHVTSGWVELQLKDRVSMVPADAACATRPGIGPGTPYWVDASETFRKALTTVDFGTNEVLDPMRTPLEVVLGEARPKDTLTLWHLLYRVEGKERELVFDRMAMLAPPPKDVTREAVLRLDDKTLHLWKGYLENSWSNDSGLKKGWLKIWTGALEKTRGLEGKK